KAPTVATSSPLPAGTVTAPYSQTLAVSDGTAPFTWSVSGGMLPPGLTLDPSGALTGTPTLDGAYSLTAQVADGAGANASKSPSITTASPLPGGSLTAPFSLAFAESGGTAPFSWAQTAGTPPGGLSLSAAGVLSGTPTAAGVFSFTVQVTDAAGVPATRDVSL